MNYADMIVSRLMTESVIKNGVLTLEEAQFFNVLTKDILNKVAELAEAEVLNGAKMTNIEENSGSASLDSATIAKKLLK